MSEIKVKVGENQRSFSAPVSVDSRGIATLNAHAIGDVLRIRYRVRNGQVWLGTNAYFFEEGTARRYEGARFGEFRVDRTSGEAVLIGLRDKDLNEMGSDPMSPLVGR